MFSSYFMRKDRQTDGRMDTVILATAPQGGERAHTFSLYSSVSLNFPHLKLI
jgi:hypothetical protein